MTDAKQTTATTIIDYRGAARLTGLSPRTIRHLARQRRIPHLRIGRMIRFDATELQAWLADRHVAAEAGAA
jgi:excisionase family DNA binding protein